MGASLDYRALLPTTPYSVAPPWELQTQKSFKKIIYIYIYFKLPIENIPIGIHVPPFRKWDVLRTHSLYLNTENITQSRRKSHGTFSTLHGLRCTPVVPMHTVQQAKCICGLLSRSSDERWTHVYWIHRMIIYCTDGNAGSNVRHVQRCVTPGTLSMHVNARL
jgi:hypothetical protein